MKKPIALALFALVLTGGCGGGDNSTPGTPQSLAQTPIPQAPALLGAASVSTADRVYTANQTSNTVSVIDPAGNTVVDTITLGKPKTDPAILGPLYNQQIGVHGLGFSPDGSLLNVISVTTNGVTIIETATGKVRGTVYIGRAPHEGFFTPDGRQIWVAVRGQDYLSVIDVAQMKEVDRIPTSDGVAMVVFRPDGKSAFANSSRTAELDVIDVASRKVVNRITGLVSPFSPNLAVSPDGKEIWMTHKDVGKVTIVEAQTFAILGVVDTGPTTNHVNFVSRAEGDFAYVTVGGLNQVKVFRRNGGAPTLVATIPTGTEPHGIWPSVDNNRVFVGLESGNAVQVIDTANNTIIATVPIGEAPQALVYVARRP